MTSPARLDEPLLFERQFLEKVWGGRALEGALGIALPPGMRVGETWEISDRANRPSVVARGRFKGRTLRELMDTYGDAILGRAAPAADGSFPLLVKYLDATQNLSVQVHPHRSLAHTLLPGESPKTECWYVVASQPGGGIWHGLRKGVEADKLASVVSGPTITSMLSWHRAEPGQFYFVPGGTVHAIGAGVTLVEIQEPSDTTYRLYDWDRDGLDGRPRDTNVEQALRSIRQPRDLRRPRRPYRRGIAKPDDVNKRGTCADCDEFGVDLLELETALEVERLGVAVVYVVVQGAGRLLAPDGSPGFDLQLGDAWLVPASLERYRLEPKGSLRVLQARTKGAA
ncbi:MAG: type I phosphomannose isomerase catalytic subunit [Planctomycetota bacterium]